MNGVRIPPAYRALCDDCGCELDVRALGVGEWCQGFTVNRSDGGAHSISARVGLERWLCRDCVKRRQANIPIEQASLFGRQ